MAFVVMLLSCVRQEDPVPFSDGLYLKYHEVFSNSERPDDVFWTRDIEYKFKKLDDGTFHVLQEVSTQKGKRIDGKLEPVPYPDVGDDLTIDKKGTVLKGGNNFNFMDGYLSYLWLPHDKRQKGDMVINVIRKAEEKRKWGQWVAVPVKGLIGDMLYYDADTGFLVGLENVQGKLRMSLVATNHKRLKGTLSRTHN